MATQVKKELEPAEQLGHRKQVRQVSLGIAGVRRAVGQQARAPRDCLWLSGAGGGGLAH